MLLLATSCAMLPHQFLTTIWNELLQEFMIQIVPKDGCIVDVACSFGHVRKYSSLIITITADPETQLVV